MGGGAKPFGIDAERAASLVRHVIAAGADWRGFRIFAGSQTLDADAIIDAQRATLGLAARLAAEADARPDRKSVVLGKSVSVRLGPVGRRIIKKKHQKSKS